MTTAPTLDQIKARDRFLNDAVIDACRAAIGKENKDLWAAWMHLAGQKIGLEEYLAKMAGTPGRYKNDWDTAVTVVGTAALQECPTFHPAEIDAEINKGRTMALEWAQGLRSLLA